VDMMRLGNRVKGAGGGVCWLDLSWGKRACVCGERFLPEEKSKCQRKSVVGGEKRTVSSLTTATGEGQRRGHEKKEKLKKIKVGETGWKSVKVNDQVRGYITRGGI